MPEAKILILIFWPQLVQPCLTVRSVCKWRAILTKLLMKYHFSTQQTFRKSVCGNSSNCHHSHECFLYLSRVVLSFLVWASVSALLSSYSFHFTFFIIYIPSEFFLLNTWLHINDGLFCLMSRYFLFSTTYFSTAVWFWRADHPELLCRDLFLINFLNPLSTVLFVVFALSVYDLWKIESGHHIHIWCKSSTRILQRAVYCLKSW